MPLKRYNPTSSGRRLASEVSFEGLAKKGGKVKSLVSRKTGQAGRNNSGQITVRHRGGGSKKLLRSVDFSRQDRKDIPAKVQALEYDPGRTAFVALLAYKDGVKRYILAPHGMQLGQMVLYGDTADILPGNRLSLGKIPVGTLVHDIELVPGMGGKIARGAGTYAILQTLESGFALLKLPSGEIRKVREGCLATVGTLSNPDNSNIRIGKAGRNRWMGKRPSVRGKAMNPVDHPHGGGKGVAPIGQKRGPQTPWGKHALGVKTRDKKKSSGKFIVKRRQK